MANYKEEVMAYISTTALSEEDSSVLKGVLENLPEELCEDVLEFFKLSPNNIHWAVKNIKEKKVALDNNDRDAFDKILADESSFLNFTIKQSQ